MTLYAVCVVIRLGCFNVMEELRQQETTKKRTYYQGLLVIMTAIIFPLVY